MSFINNIAAQAFNEISQKGPGFGGLQRNAPGITGLSFLGRNLPLLEFGQDQKIEGQLLSASQNAGLGQGGGGGLNLGAPRDIVFGSIQDKLNQARQQRGQEFQQGALGRIDPNAFSGDTLFASDRLKDLALGMDSQQLQALRSRGQEGIQQNFLSSLRDLRALNSDRSVPSELAASRKADLLRDRLRASKDLEQGMIIDDLNRRQSVLSQLDTLTSGAASRRQSAQQANAALELQERLNRLGNPELAATLLADIEKTNAANRAAILAQNLQAQQAQQQLASQNRQADLDRLIELL